MHISRNIKNYFIADIISLLGCNLSLISINWFILEETGLNENVGIFTFLGVIGGLLTAPFGGIITDYFSRKKILIYSNFIRATAISIIVVLLLSEKFQIYYVYLLAIINGIGFNIYLPSSRALVQEIVNKKDLIKWNSVIEMTIHLSMIAAGAITGIIYKTCGIYFILIMNSITFLMSNLFLYKISHKHTARTQTQKTLFAKFYQGANYLLSNRSFLIFILIMLLPHVATIMLNIVLPGYVLHHLNSNSVTYGIINMCVSIGSITGAFFMHYMNRDILHRHHIGILLFVSIVALIILMVTPLIMIAYIAILFFGLCNSALKIILHSTIMKITHQDYMGRVISIKNLISTLFQMTSAYSIGIIMDKYGDIWGYLSLLIVMLTSLCSYLYFFKNFKKILED